MLRSLHGRNLDAEMARCRLLFVPKPGRILRGCLAVAPQPLGYYHFLIFIYYPILFTLPHRTRENLFWMELATARLFLRVRNNKAHGSGGSDCLLPFQRSIQEVSCRLTQEEQLADFCILAVSKANGQREEKSFHFVE
jgi:hypothetical protein